MERTGRLTTPRAQRVRRSRGARAVVILTVIFLSAALARLQIVNGEELAQTSRTNRMRPLVVPAPRGTIYDRYGQIIAENVPAYQVQIMPDAESTRTGKLSVEMQAQIDSLRPILGLTEDHITVALRKWRQATNYPMPLLADASPKAIARLQERSYMFPEVVVNEYAKRRYPAGSAIAHMIGYVAEIDGRDTALARFKGYEQGRLIGKAGFERQYEEVLGGTPGKRFMKVDARGRILEWLPEEQSQPPVPGRDMQLSLDLDLQRYVEELWRTSPDIQGKNGAFVAIDPRTGGILALYSHPSYDPNAFTGGIGYEEYNFLNTHPDKPLLNRASGTGSAQPPASTWKLLMAAMALDLGVIEPKEVMPLSCTGGMTFGRYARCHAVHGPQNMIQGIFNSCDVYFYQVGIRIGLERYLKTGTRMGFANRTGIDLPAEMQNIFPTGIDWYPKHFRNNYRPNENEIMSLSIGQSVTTMTPIKMAQMYVALARPDGVAFEPRLAVLDEPPTVSFKLNVSEENLDYMRQGMRLVVGPGGTAQLSRIQHWDFFGKTGTAQSCANCPASTDHAWFVGMAGPRGKHPEIVAAMFVEYGEHGYTPSGHIANAVNFFLNRKYGRPFERYPVPRDRFRMGLPTGDWVYSPLTHPTMDDLDTYPTIDKIQAEWQKRGKSIEGLAAAVKPMPTAAPAASGPKSTDSTKKPVQR